MSNQPQETGFDPHVWSQLNHAAAQGPQRARGRGRGRGQGRGGRQGSLPQLNHNQYPAPMSPRFQSPPLSMDSFLPLGTPPPLGSAGAAPMSPGSPQTFSRPQSRGNSYPRAPSREFHTRGPSNHTGYSQYGQSHQFSQPARQAFAPSYDDYRRPVAPGASLYQPAAVPQPFSGPFSSYDEKERTFRKQVMAQSDYLNKIQVATRQKYQLKQDEQILKENFRRRLEDIFHTALVKKYPSTAVDDVRLRCYGSLNNGFGLAECDMDLLLSLPSELDLINNAAVAAQDDQPDTVIDISEQQTPSTPAQPSAQSSQSDDDKFEVALLLEGALLDLGIGARLLTRTRVPILRVCERPGEELLANLRAYRAECQEAEEAAKKKSRDPVAETPPELSMSDISTALQGTSSEDVATQVGLPDSPPKTKQPSLEFTGDCGIECDINFTNFVAIHNTRLLREYCLYDSRVAEIGTFVKAWVKIRDINTPYWGTLSSYGYILMVLHYLMNVAQPPVIPNLQDLACSEGSWDSQPVAKFEAKYDIRFWNDAAKIQAYKAQQPRNRESTGHLLRGFFWYYSAREGFNFKNDIISIRTRGGILKKFQKGWTEAKWADQKKNIRQRYLLAIEDPFEVDHNVARVVGHNGIVAIRDEFRRAWTLISSIGGPEESVESLLDPVEARGDLLRKDQEHHREKIRKMKQELEAKEKQALKEASDEAEKKGLGEADEIRTVVLEEGEKQDTGTLSQRNESPSSKPSRRRRSPDTQLTQGVGNYQVKLRQPKRGRVRKIKQDSDSEDESSGHVESGGRKSDQSRVLSGQAIDMNMEPRDVKMLGNDESDLEPFFSPSELCLSQGFDIEGNPVAWDLSTQDGRWLQWRDNKIRAGKWKGVKIPNLIEHDQRYPYDPRRPKADTHEYKLANELFYVDRAPYPMKKVLDITSTETAISAGISKVPRKPGKPRRSRRFVKTDSSSPPATRNGTEFQTTLDAQPSSKDEPNSTDFAGGAWSGKAGLSTKPVHSLTHPHEVVSKEVPTEPRHNATAHRASGAGEAAHILHGIEKSGPSLNPGSVYPAGDERYTMEPSTSDTVSHRVELDHQSSQLDYPVSIRAEASAQIEDEAAYLLTDPFPHEILDAGMDDPLIPRQLSDRNNNTPPFSSRKRIEPQRDLYHMALEERSLPRSRPTMSKHSPAFRKSAVKADWLEVGLPIDWDRSTVGGRWLCTRDALLRLGRFSVPENHHLTALHELYPYDSSMPRWKLRVYNAELRAYYKYSLRPRDVQVSPYVAGGRDQSGSGANETRIIHKIDWDQKPLNLYSAHWPQYSLSELPPPTSKAVDFVSSFKSNVADHNDYATKSDDTEVMPDTAFIRSRRLAYFAERELRELDDDQIPDGADIQNITALMHQAGISSQDAPQVDAGENSVQFRPNSGYVSIQNTATSTVGSTTTPEQQSFSSSFESKGVGTETSEQHHPVGGSESLKVPLTLLPHVPGHERPRDEDPNIMPTPRERGFKFDVRQLRDLSVIKEGGNGCAKAGYEFEIEDEHEWTGSGAVEWVGSSVRYEGSSEGEQKPSEHGNGDAVDLLAELPGPEI